MYFLQRVHPRLSSFLDLARWVAAELVVLNHVRSFVLANWTDLDAGERGPFTAALYLLCSLGHQSVVVFFVLSGFLVGGSVIGDLRQQRFAFGRYLINRVSRLYVVLIPALLLGWSCDAIGARWFDAQGLYHGHWPTMLASLPGNVSDDLSWTAALGNAANLQTILVPTLGSNGPLWSLANEFWYYILFPLLLVPFTGQRSRVVRVVVGILAVAVAALIYPWILAYGLIWVLGACLRLCPAPLLRRPWLAAALVPLALGLTVFLPRLVPAAGGQLAGLGLDTVLGLAFANWLLSLMHAQSEPALPGAGFHAAVANYSYSLYLLHFPLLLLLLAIAQSTWGFGLALKPGWAASALMLVLLLAANAYAWAWSLVTERRTAVVRGWLMRLCYRTPPADGVARPPT